MLTSQPVVAVANLQQHTRLSLETSMRLQVIISLREPLTNFHLLVLAVNNTKSSQINHNPASNTHTKWGHTLYEVQGFRLPPQTAIRGTN